MKKLITLAACCALALGAAACGDDDDSNSSSGDGKLSGTIKIDGSSTVAPFAQAAQEAFQAENPDVTAIDGTIAGGGGSNVQVALAARLHAGDPPDVWQTFLGSSLRAWVDAGRIADVSAVYDRTGLDRTMPPALLDAATYRVKAWGVPTGSHRGNVLWFNENMLKDARVSVPGPGYTTEAFTSDLAKVAASGRTPLCLGGKDRFTATELFENTLLGVIGTDGWAKIRDDSFDWRGPQLTEALTRFGQIVSRDWVGEMVRPRSDVPSESMRYGLGFWLHGSTDTVILVGSDAGVSFRSVHDPRALVTHTVISNVSDGAWAITDYLDHRLGT